MARSTDRGEQLRAAAARPSRRWPAGADVIYQATFFDGTLARPRRLPAARRRPGSPVASGARGTTRSPTPSSPGTSRRARSSRSARTSTSSSGSRACARSGCTSRSGGSARARRAAARRRLHGLLPERPDRFLATLADDDAADLPAGRHLPGPGRALRRLPLGRRMRRPSPRRRPPQPRRRDLGAPAPRARRRAASTTLEALGDLAAADATRRSRATSDGALARVREQARIQLEGRRDGRLELRAASARSRTRRSSPNAGWRRCRRRRRATCSSTSRAIRTPSTTGSTTSSASSRPTAAFHAFWSRDDAGEFTLDGERRGVRAAHRLLHGAPRRATRRCTSTTTRRTSRPR